MADNLRKVLDLTGTQFADGQAAKSITPQDMRDLIDTFTTQYLVTTLAAGATMTLTGGGTEDVYALTDSVVKAKDWTRDSAGTYSYDKGPVDSVTGATTGTRSFIALGMASVEMITGISEVEFSFAKNATKVVSTLQGNNLQTAVLPDQVIWGGILVDLVATDVITVLIENMTDTDNITINYLNTFLIGMPD